MLLHVVGLAAIGLALAFIAAPPTAARDLAQFPESVLPATEAEVSRTLTRVHETLRGERGGANADYIPELARVDPDLFALAVATVDGRLLAVGDVDAHFTIQSVAKPFTAALAIERHGLEALLAKVGAYSTGFAFNSVLASELRPTRLQNPLVNAGAIATASLIGREGSNAQADWEAVRDNLSAFAGRPLGLDEAVFRSEAATNSHNRALSWLLYSHGLFYDDVDAALDRYTRQGSLSVTVTDLAKMGATLANGGVNPWTGETVVAPATAQAVLSLMAVAGLYDGAGAWTVLVGLPAKSGVGGGIVTVVPNRFAIATFSPPLNLEGNSQRGVAAIRELVSEWSLHPFAATPR